MSGDQTSFNDNYKLHIFILDHDLQLMIDKQYKFLQVLGSIGAIVLLLCRYWGSIAIGIGSTATANSTIAIGI